MTFKTCNHPDCSNPRWTGPSDTDPGLVYCEFHQRAIWQKAATLRESVKPTRARKQVARTCKKTLTINRRRGLVVIQQETALDDFKQLEKVIEMYRQQGYQVVEKR